MRTDLALIVFAVFFVSPAVAAPAIEPWEKPWSAGAENCATNKDPPLEVREYDPYTYVLRESPCATWEAPFMYLVIGDNRALLIDTGDVADAQKVPLARTVMQIVADQGGPHVSLLVVHTHRHLDHRAGDVQFLGLKNVELVGYDIDSVKRFYGFKDWPNETAEIDLGNRTVDVVPAPGHNETELVFYDRKASLVFSGDFMMPGRLLVDDPAAEKASARRVADFVRLLRVNAVFGGHVEMNARGELFDWESTYHPHEHPLAMTKADLLALPAAFDSFNGFYTKSGAFTFIDSLRILAAIASAGILTLAGLGFLAFFLLRRRRLSR